MPQEKKFYLAGKLIAMSIVQDGSGFPCLAPPVYDYLCGKVDCDISLEDIACYEVKDFLEQVSMWQYHSAQVL